jgi:putative PLP-dependent aminotransferase (TIGR04422 family)
MKFYFLWPNSYLIRAFISAYKFTKVEKVEKKLFEMFPSGYPVLCSSGRSAITLALQQSNKNRKNFIGLFPFASHCVIDAVSRISTPLFGQESINADLRLVYHQWGYVQEKKIEFNSIEDCVDTLCLKGTILFPGGGSFEIWSLPKILGTTSGGVLWCKDEKMAIEIRNLRDKKKGSLFQWVLRLISNKVSIFYDYWNGGEPSCGKPSRFQTGEIMSAINKWDIFVNDRLKKIDLVWHFAVTWLQKPTNRLPSVIPINCLLCENDIISNGLTAGSRMFEKLKPDGTRELIKVIPVPIHQDINELDLYKIINKITNQKQ